MSDSGASQTSATCADAGCVVANGGEDGDATCQDPPDHCAVVQGGTCTQCHDPYVLSSDGASCAFQLPPYIPVALAGVGLLFLIVSEIAHHRNKGERRHYRQEEMMELSLIHI